MGGGGNTGMATGITASAMVAAWPRACEDDGDVVVSATKHGHIRCGTIANDGRLRGTQSWTKGDIKISCSNGRPGGSGIIATSFLVGGGGGPHLAQKS